MVLGHNFRIPLGLSGSAHTAHTFWWNFDHISQLIFWEGNNPKNEEEFHDFFPLESRFHEIVMWMYEVSFSDSPSDPRDRFQQIFRPCNGTLMVASLIFDLLAYQSGWQWADSLQETLHCQWCAGIKEEYVFGDVAHKKKVSKRFGEMLIDKIDKIWFAIICIMATKLFTLSTDFTDGMSWFWGKRESDKSWQTTKSSKKIFSGQWLFLVPLYCQLWWLYISPIPPIKGTRKLHWCPQVSPSLRIRKPPCFATSDPFPIPLRPCFVDFGHDGDFSI